MEKQTKMFQLVKECQESGLSRKSFAQQHGLTVRSLEYWFRKHGKQTAPLAVATKTLANRTKLPSFIELSSQSSVSSPNRQAQIELELANGLRVKIY